MKITHRIPTKEYAYVELEFDDQPNVADGEKIAFAHQLLLEAFQPKAGLSEKDFNKAVDEYRNTGTLKEGTELYQQMSDKQKFYFQVSKKADKRANYQTSE